MLYISEFRYFDISEFRYLYDHGKITVISFICTYTTIGLLSILLLNNLEGIYSERYSGDYLKSEQSAACFLKTGKKDQVSLRDWLNYTQEKNHQSKELILCLQRPQAVSQPLEHSFRVTSNLRHFYTSLLLLFRVTVTIVLRFYLPTKWSTALLPLLKS